MTSYPLELRCEARLSDGSVAAIRPIRPEDAQALEGFHEHLSSETVYRRFFTAHPHLRAQEVERYTRRRLPKPSGARSRDPGGSVCGGALMNAIRARTGPRSLSW